MKFLGQEREFQSVTCLKHEEELWNYQQHRHSPQRKLNFFAIHERLGRRHAVRLLFWEAGFNDDRKT
jgi:hypothetical protein